MASEEELKQVREEIQKIRERIAVLESKNPILPYQPQQPIPGLPWQGYPMIPPIVYYRTSTEDQYKDNYGTVCCGSK